MQFSLKVHRFVMKSARDRMFKTDGANRDVLPCQLAHHAQSEVRPSSQGCYSMSEVWPRIFTSACLAMNAAPGLAALARRQLISVELHGEWMELHSLWRVYRPPYPT